MILGKKVYAVVLDTGVVQAITDSLSTASKASLIDMEARRHSKGTNSVEEVVVIPFEGKRAIDWVVEYVENGCTSYEYLSTRSDAREFKKWIKKCLGVPSKIIRQEYVLISEKVVS